MNETLDWFVSVYWTWIFAAMLMALFITRH